MSSESVLPSTKLLAAGGGLRSWVLGRLTEEELGALPRILDRVEAAAGAWLDLDIQRAMSQVNKPEQRA